MSKTSVRRTGDWAGAQSLMRTLPGDIRRAADKVTKDEAQRFLKAAQRAFDTSGGSNNARWEGLKRSSTLGRGGGGPLLNSGSLKKSMHVKRIGRGKYGIAFRGGRGVSSRTMTKIALTHEKGAVIPQKVTLAKFRAVMAKMSKGSKTKGNGTFRPGAIVLIKIPRRSFLEDTKKAHFSGLSYSNTLMSKMRRKLVKYHKLF